MRVSLLNLISTPVALVPSTGLEVRAGLSSDDPVVGRRASEPYDAYLSVYAPDGSFARRLLLGRIPPRRREGFDLSTLTGPLGFQEDHLAVLHRVPASLAERYGVIDTPVALPDGLDYVMFRSYVQYAYPGARGAHGGIIYEIPPRFNEAVPGKPAPTVLTFTTKIVLSEQVSTEIVLTNPSTDPDYHTTADYRYAVHTGDGARVAVGLCAVPPFSVRRLDMQTLIPEAAVAQARDPQDGLSHFCFYGICENAALAILVLNLAPTLQGVSVEHTHPTQGYLMSFDAAEKYRVKRQAIAAWRGLIHAAMTTPVSP